MSSFDEQTYGKVGADITFAYLRKMGFLVPKVNIRLLRLSELKKAARGLSERMKKEGERESVDMNEAALEGAAVIRVRQDMLANIGVSNIIIAGKQRAMGEIEHRSPAIREALDTAKLYAVYGNTSAIERTAAFDDIKSSTDSVLWQHSVVKEGIDVPAFNAGILSRRMELIGTQQFIGRIVRTFTGTWTKECAVLYVIVDDEDSAAFADEVTELIKTLIGCGLKHEEDFDVQFADTEEERTNLKIDESGVLAHVDTHALVEKAALAAKLKNLVIEVVNVEEHDLAYDSAREQAHNKYKDAQPIDLI